MRILVTGCAFEAIEVVDRSSRKSWEQTFLMTIAARDRHVSTR